MFVKWARDSVVRHPELELLHHIPNGGWRRRVTAAILKAIGAKPGVPDYCLPVPRGGYHGLYIEMKAARGRSSCSQRWWINKLSEQGYCAVICYGGTAAIYVTERYLEDS